GSPPRRGLALPRALRDAGGLPRLPGGRGYPERTAPRGASRHLAEARGVAAADGAGGAAGGPRRDGGGGGTRLQQSARGDRGPRRAPPPNKSGADDGARCEAHPPGGLGWGPDGSPDPGVHADTSDASVRAREHSRAPG